MFQCGSDDALEDNHTRDTAPAISAGSYCNLVVKVHDEDWYKMNVPANKCISVYLTFTHDFGDIDLELYRGFDTNPISSSTGDGDSKYVEHCNFAGTTDYFIHVFLNDGVRNTYDMKAMFNQLQNPGFEDGQSSWVEYSSGNHNIIWQKSELAHSGSWFSWMGGFENVEEYIYQDATIPSNATNAYISFWYWIHTDETTTTVVFDTMAAEIRRPSDNVLLKTLVTLSNINTSSQWIMSDQYDVSEFIGQTIRLKFYAINDFSGPTDFRVDDIGLWVAFPITEAVSVPIPPNGPSSGTTGTSYAYTTGDSNSILNHPVEYQFDWKGDGSTDLSDWGLATQSKNWSTPGTYYVRARGRCTTHNDKVSNWSNSVTVAITQTTLSYTVTTNPSGLQIAVDGSVYTAPYTFSWTPGSNHTISVSSPQRGAPGTRYLFSSWSDGGDQSHQIIAPSSSMTYTATFTTQYSLTVSLNPPEGGTVNPSGSNWYNGGQPVSISAMPNSGYTFIGWSGDISGTTNPASITINGPMTVTANFSQVNYTLSLSKTGNGSVGGNGTLQFLPWSGQYASGTEVQLEAVPGSGWSFSSWGGDMSGNVNLTNIPMSGDKNVIANFRQNQYTLTVNINPSGWGSVTRNPDKPTYVYGDQVTLAATANTGHNFSNWSGDANGSVNAILLTIDGNKTVTANFNVAIGPDLTGLWTTPVTQTCKNTRSGQKCTIKGTFAVNNIGNQDAPYALIVFYLSDNDTYNEEDRLLNEVLIGKVKAGKNKDIKLNYNKFSVGESASGKYIIVVIKGPNSETRVNNNIIPFGPIP